MNSTTTFLPRTPLPLPPEVVQGKAIRNVYIWVLVGVGLPGNFACLVTILSMQITTATFYVALLAAADSVALLLKLVFHQLITHSKMTTAACIFSDMPAFFSCYANWVLALICFERFLTVYFPLKKQVYFTKRRVYISAIVLLLALATCFAPTAFFHKDVHGTRRFCVLRESMREYIFQVWQKAFLASLYFFAPFLMIAVFTTLIIHGLQRHQAIRTRTEGSGSNDRTLEHAISIMLLCAGLVFLLLVLPSCVYHLFLKKLYDLTVRDEAAQSFLFYQVTTLLADTNHAVNFIIYFLSAPRFRRRSMELLKRCLCFTRRRSSPFPHSSEDGVELTQVSQPQNARNTSDSTAPA